LAADHASSFSPASPERSRSELGWMLEGSPYAWDAPAIEEWTGDLGGVHRCAAILVHHSSGIAADFLSAVDFPRAVPPVIRITADTDGSARLMQERHPHLPFFLGTAEGGILREPFGREKLIYWIDRVVEKVRLRRAVARGAI
jgi:hypothetical protein